MTNMDKLEKSELPAQEGKLSAKVLKYKETLQKEMQRKQVVGIQDRRIDVHFRNLSVWGQGGIEDVLYGGTVATAFNPIGAARDAKKAQAISAKRHEAAAKERGATPANSSLKSGERFILQDLNGLVKSGEMCLVVGRPGSGTTTFLKAIAGLTAGYAGVDGEVIYNTSNMAELGAGKKQVLFCSEDDVFYANLKVGQTLEYASALNVPSARPPTQQGQEKPSPKEFVEQTVSDLLALLGLSHTRSSMVGDAYVRGVSGGERRRTTIAEALTNGSALTMWDNASRGLDASTALSFVEVMRVMSDVLGNTNIISLYQAGNHVYDLFDRVLVLAEGQCIYYGPRSTAKSYFEELGFECADGANVADFLTGVTVPSERKVRDDVRGVPTTPAEFVKAYQSSEIGLSMQNELHEHIKDELRRSKQHATFLEAVAASKQSSTRKNSPKITGYATQLRAAMKREIQLRWADKPVLIIRLGSTFVLSFVYSTAYYQAPRSVLGAFSRGAICFLSVLQPSLQSLSETTASFEGRGVLAKHQGMKMLHPAIVVLAQTLIDLPFFFVQFAQFGAAMYFLSGLRSDAGAFFIYFLFLCLSLVTMTAVFRLIGNAFTKFQDASAASGVFFISLFTYAGFMIPPPQMRPYFAWTRYINPFYYAFEAMMIAEFRGQTFDCVPPYLVPYGPGYEGGAAGCAFPGATAGSLTVSGEAYIQPQYGLRVSHLWRNFGILLAMAIFFIGATMAVVERLKPAGSTKSYLLYKRGSNAQPKDAEDQISKSPSSGRSERTAISDDMKTGKTTLSWRKLNYHVNGLHLLKDVEGFVRPGELCALMGASGAGKTTLMDCLAMRKDTGELKGEILVNGKELPISFQRTTGYCEQMDVHQPEATVREALEFSALLRQPRTLSDEEKLSYVDVVIDLLEMHDIADALVGTPECGLSIEQRKRLTIGVELVAKPRLLFLDEPTSGLDGQSSFLIVTFLRKLAELGQSCITVIHQPSASLFAEFDKVLLLKKGGETVYLFMIDVVSQEKDWAAIWRESDEHTQIVGDLDQITKDTKQFSEDDKVDADDHKYASSQMYQNKVVLRRANVQLWRQVDYVTSKVALHLIASLFNGFSFFLIGSRFKDLQARVFSIFIFVFIAPGVMAQTQPKFIANRDVFETREKKAMVYSWKAFIFAEMVSELPYLLVCGLIYWFCWFFPVGFSLSPGVALPTLMIVLLYEGFYTALGQAIAAYSPNPTFAALVNPFFIAILAQFCGVLAPYAILPVWWRDWLYYLNPFTYITGSMVAFNLRDAVVNCAEDEFATFAPPTGQSCGDYMAAFISRSTGYLADPSSTTQCQYCLYSNGSEWIPTLNINNPTLDGWKFFGIIWIFVISTYCLVVVFMKLRSKATKSAQ